MYGIQRKWHYEVEMQRKLQNKRHNNTHCKCAVGTDYVYIRLFVVVYIIHASLPLHTQFKALLASLTTFVILK